MRTFGYCGIASETLLDRGFRSCGTLLELCGPYQYL